MIALLSLAHAASVAVVNLDAYGVEWEDARAVSEDLRAALLAEGELDPLSGADTADGASRGQDAALRSARELVGSARRSMAEGDTEAALEALSVAISLHKQARSDVGHRDELADAHYLAGLCLFELRRGVEAQERFAEANRLYPGYGRTRATDPPEGVGQLLRAAEVAHASGERQERAARDVAAIGEALQVDYVVTGWVAEDGEAHARIWEGTRVAGQATVTLAEVPPEDDGALRELARRLAAAVAPEVAEVEEQPPARTKVPLTDQWWFWTGVLAVVGGTGATVAAVLYEPEPRVVEEPDGWTVTVGVP